MIDYKKHLLDYMDTLPVIDSHSHLHTEEQYLAEKPDVVTRLLGSYLLTNLVCAGFPKSAQWLHDTSIPFEERWEAVRPYLNVCRETGFSHTARKFTALYGIDDINDETVDELNRHIRAHNVPGMMHHYLRDICNIRTVINLAEYTGPYVPSVSWEYRPLWDNDRETALNRLLETFPDAASIEMMVKASVAQTAKKHIAIKLYSHPRLLDALISSEEAERYLALYRLGQASETEIEQLSYYICDQVLEECGKHELVVCVHAGPGWGCGIQYNRYNPRHLAEAVSRHPNTRFDIYHGVPWMREMAALGYHFPNVYLNLVWSYSLSPHMLCRSLDEWLDLVPVNKIIGFGGDAHTLEDTYGALCMAKECIAHALAKRCEEGMRLEYAEYICRMWLYENPVQLYRLKERGLVED